MPCIYDVVHHKHFFRDRNYLAIHQKKKKFQKIIFCLSSSLHCHIKSKKDNASKKRVSEKQWVKLKSSMSAAIFHDQVTIFLIFFTNLI